jgi:RAC serine/threonine-protein kinase
MPMYFYETLNLFRYFMLLADGRLLGYRSRPISPEEAEQPLNNFTVRGCQLLKIEIPR